MCILNMFRNVLLMFPVLLQRCFYHFFGQRFECIVRMVSQFLNALQRFAKIMSCYIFLLLKTIFTRLSPLAAPQVTCHQASPLQTMYGRETYSHEKEIQTIGILIDPEYILKTCSNKDIYITRKNMLKTQWFVDVV